MGGTHSPRKMTKGTLQRAPGGWGGGYSNMSMVCVGEGAIRGLASAEGRKGRAAAMLHRKWAKSMSVGLQEAHWAPTTGATAW